MTREPMSAREVLTVMVRTTLGDMTVHSPDQVEGAIDAYRAEVLREAAADLVSACPEHSTADEAWFDCPCHWADELRLWADAERGNR